MATLKRRKLAGYILLESLVALSILVAISSLVLTEIQNQRSYFAHKNHEQEVLQLATMAVQTGQKELALNGVEVTVTQSLTELSVQADGKELIHVRKN